MDLAQVLEALVIVLVTFELIELVYHIYEMRRYEKHVEWHLTKMDVHMLKMDQVLSTLESHLTKLDKLIEQTTKESK